MNKAKKYYRKWFWTAPLGLVLIGAGISMVTDASQFRTSGAPFWDWVAYGTLSLVVLNAGISVFGQAVVYRCRYEWEREKETSQR